ncbi:MAG: ATPase [Bacillati bacterium ANGP1]|uniref:ATPase n=2 Tax=Candidatus Segetimicrobium genomatis TaxID=2569760 RepID=A0A537INI5_9BACT|nr:MAG: ATPase [Terrabacteria group bacterium ANGP1]
MLPWERLRDKILTLEGKPFQAYQALDGEYRFERFALYVDRVIVEPPGVPSPLRVRIDQAEARFPASLWASRPAKIALEDFIARRWLDTIRKVARARGGRPQFAIDVGGQQILERTACRIAEDYVEIRCAIYLPAEGRKIASKAAQTVFFEDLPQLVDGALIYPNLNPNAAQRHVEATEDAEALRLQLSSRGLVAFLAEGAVLPRESGSDRPLLSHLVPLAAPPELKVTLDLPHRGAVSGMGIPRGVTVIMGSPFSGRSTLLRAIAAGVYPHLPGDGREHCATVADAVLVRAEEGRRVEGVNISAFLTAPPSGEDPSRCRTEHAGDVVSQAAGIAEALEAGCSVLLIDEDTSAPGLLARDPLWRQLAPEVKQPVNPLAEIARPLFEEHGVSTVVVTGHSSEYAAGADTVVAMDGFRPRAMTAEVRQAAHVAGPGAGPKGAFGGVHHRVPLPEGFAFLRGRRLRGDSHPGTHGIGTVFLGRDTMDLATLEQLVDPAQARAVAVALIWVADRGLVDGMRTVRELLGLIEVEVAQRGLEGLVPEGVPGDLALPRRQEIAAAINRLRTLRVKS